MVIAPNAPVGMGNYLANLFGNVPQASKAVAKAGGNKMAFERVRNGDVHTVRDAQQFLVHHGYGIGVDGIWGPQTAGALKAYLKGIKPPKAVSQRTRYVPPAPNVHPAPKAGPAPKGGGGNGGKGGKSPRGGVGRGVPHVGPGNNPGPKQVAQSMVNAEYDPAIAQLQGLLGDVANQDKYNQGQIKGYYKQMQGLDTQQSADQGANTHAGIQDVVNTIGQAGQLFGGSNVPAMQATADNAAGYLGAVGRSQQDYLANMLPLLDAQAASGVANAHHAASAQQRNYSDQLLSQQHAKGQAYVSAYQQAINDQATRKQNQLALQEAQSMLPYKVQAAKYGAQSAKYGAKSAKVQAKYAGQAAQADLAGKQAQLDHYRALTQQEMAAAKADVAKAQSAGGGQDVLAPGSTTAKRIQDSLYRSMTNGAGKIVIPNPIMAQRALFQNAIQQGLIDKQGRPLVPGAVRLLNSTLLNMYNRDAAWQNSYKWNGRTFVAKK